MRRKTRLAIVINVAILYSAVPFSACLLDSVDLLKNVSLEGFWVSVDTTINKLSSSPLPSEKETKQGHRFEAMAELWVNHGI